MNETTFVLPTPMNIRGHQLADEILQATGFDVLERYSFYTPDQVRIAGDDVAAAQAAIQAVIDVHVPNPLYFPEDRERARAEAAETTVASIPGWATWTLAEVQDWYDTNIGTPIDNAPEVVTSQNAVAVLQGVVNILKQFNTLEGAEIMMLIAARNKLWPNLEGS